MDILNVKKIDLNDASGSCLCRLQEFGATQDHSHRIQQSLNRELWRLGSDKHNNMLRSLSNNHI
jgi:hypothetical protein